MKLTRIDRLEHIESIIQKKIANTEEQIESLGRMIDPEICRIRNMYLLDLGELRHNLFSIRHKIDLEYAMRKDRKAFHDEIQSFTEGSHVGGQHEENQRRRRIPEHAAGTGDGGAVSHVGRDGGHIPEDGQGNRRAGRAYSDAELKEWQIEIMRAAEEYKKTHESPRTYHEYIGNANESPRAYYEYMGNEAGKDCCNRSIPYKY